MAKAITAPELKGLVLTGGDSRRMGADKASMVFHEQTLLERAINVLQGVVPEVFVSARTEQREAGGRADCSLIEDSVAVRGPAAGILSAHLHDPAAAWLVLACDLPRVSGELLQALVTERDADVAATAWSAEQAGQAEPLCAVYEPATLAAFLRAVGAGLKPSPQQWLDSQQVKLLERPAGAALQGANTLEELAELQDQFQRELTERKQDEQ